MSDVKRSLVLMLRVFGGNSSSAAAADGATAAAGGVGGVWEGVLQE